MFIVHFTLLKKAYLFLFSVYECFACMYVSVTCLPGVLRDLKRASDPLALELEESKAPCGCWKPTLGPLQEQQVLSTSEPPPYPQVGLLRVYS